MVKIMVKNFHYVYMIIWNDYFKESFNFPPPPLILPRQKTGGPLSSRPLLTLLELYSSQYGRSLMRSSGWKGYRENRFLRSLWWWGDDCFVILLNTIPCMQVHKYHLLSFIYQRLFFFFNHPCSLQFVSLTLLFSSYSKVLFQIQFRL